MADSTEFTRIRHAFEQAQRALRLIEDGRVMKQDIYVQDGLDKLKRAFRELEPLLKRLQ